MMQQLSHKYIVAYGYNDKFYLTEEEAKALVAAAEKGAKLVKFSNRVLSTSFTWVMPVDDVTSVGNPILRDPIFLRYLDAYHKTDDGSIRLKMSLLPRLESMYPTERFSKEWEEASGILKDSQALVTKQL